MTQIESIVEKTTVVDLLKKKTPIEEKPIEEEKVLSIGDYGDFALGALMSSAANKGDLNKAREYLAKLDLLPHHTAYYESLFFEKEEKPLDAARAILPYVAFHETETKAHLTKLSHRTEEATTLHELRNIYQDLKNNLISIELDDAINFLEDMIKDGFSPAQVLTLKSEIYYQHEKFDKSALVLDDINILHSTDKLFDKAEVNFVDGTLEFEDEFYILALRYFNISTDADFNHQSAWRGKAVVLEKLGEYELALDAINITNGLRTTDSQNYELLSSILMHLEKPEEALSAIDFAIMRDRSNPEFHFRKGRILLNLEKDYDAVSSFKEVVTLEPESESAWYNLGLCYHNLNYFKKAINAFFHCLNTTNDIDNDAKCDFLSAIQTSYDALGQWQKIIDISADYLSEHPTEIMLKFNTAIANTNLNEFDISNKLLDEIITTLADNNDLKLDYITETTNNSNKLRINNLMGLEKYQKALPYIEKILIAEPEDLMNYYAKAEILAQIPGKELDVLSVYTTIFHKISDIDKKQKSFIRLGQAQILHGLNKKDKAFSYIKKSLKENPEDIPTQIYFNLLSKDLGLNSDTTNFQMFDFEIIPQDSQLK